MVPWFHGYNEKESGSLEKGGGGILQSTYRHFEEESCTLDTVLSVLLGTLSGNLFSRNSEWELFSQGSEYLLREQREGTQCEGVLREQ